MPQATGAGRVTSFQPCACVQETELECKRLEGQKLDLEISLRETQQCLHQQQDQHEQGGQQHIETERSKLEVLRAASICMLGQRRQGKLPPPPPSPLQPARACVESLSTSIAQEMVHGA